MSQFIYWGDASNGKIERVSPSGTGREVIVSGLSVVQGIYVHHRDQKLYWVDRGTDKIQRSNLDGTNIENVVTSGLLDPQGIIIDESQDYIYWIDGTTDNIKRCNIDGSNIQVIVSGLTFGEDLVLDKINNKIYWTDSGPPNDVVQKSNLDGSNIQTIVTGQSNPEGIDIDVANNKIYFANSDAKQIKRCNTDGSSLQTINNTAGVPVGLVLDLKNSKIYWLELTPNSLIQSNLDGTGKTSVLTSLNNPQQLDIYTEPIQSSGNINFHIHGFDVVNDDLDFYIYNKESTSGQINFCLVYPSFINTDVPLFISHIEVISGLIDISLTGYDIFNSDIDFFIEGDGLSSNELPLFIFSQANLQNNFNLFTAGLNSPINISCPTLDLTASIQIGDDLIGIYQSRIDALINQLGKNILLKFDPLIENCPNCKYDSISKRSSGIYKDGGPIQFSRGQKCPYCKGDGVIYYEATKCIKCLVKWNPKDLSNYGISVQRPKSIVRLKAFLTDASDIIRAKTAIIDYDINTQFSQIVYKVKGPVPIGLREDRYCVSFWSLMDI